MKGRIVINRNDVYKPRGKTRGKGVAQMTQKCPHRGEGVKIAQNSVDVVCTPSHNDNVLFYKTKIFLTSNIYLCLDFVDGTVVRE